VVDNKITRDNWMESEMGIDLVMGEAERMIKQFSLMMGVRENKQPQ
jgi:hypothetical protein